MKSMVKRTGAMLAIAAYATTVLAGFGIAGITARRFRCERGAYLLL